MEKDNCRTRDFPAQAERNRLAVGWMCHPFHRVSYTERKTPSKCHKHWFLVLRAALQDNIKTLFSALRFLKKNRHASHAPDLSIHTWNQEISTLSVNTPMIACFTFWWRIRLFDDKKKIELCQRVSRGTMPAIYLRCEWRALWIGPTAWAGKTTTTPPEYHAIYVTFNCFSKEGSHAWGIL